MCCHVVFPQSPLWSNVYFLASGNGWLQPLFTGRVGAQRQRKTQSTSKTSLFWKLPDGHPDKGEDATIPISTGLAERALYPVQTGGEVGPAYGPIEPSM